MTTTPNKLSDWTLLITALPNSGAITDKLCDSLLNELPILEKKEILGECAVQFKIPIEFLTGDIGKAESTILRIFNSEDIDIDVNYISNQKKKEIKLLVADLESTIIEQECLDELAKFCDAEIEEKMKRITYLAMEGVLDFESALKERVMMLKGLPIETLEKVRKKLTLTSGAKELIATMKNNGATCILASGGFSFFAEPIAKQLGFDKFYCNDLIIENGKLTGEIKKPILNKDSKSNILNDWEEKLLDKDKGIIQITSMAVGDGANDAAMLESATFGVGFRAKDALEHTQYRIDHCDLTALLYMQGYKQSEFIES